MAHRQLKNTQPLDQQHLDRLNSDARPTMQMRSDELVGLIAASSDAPAPAPASAPAADPAPAPITATPARARATPWIILACMLLMLGSLAVIAANWS